MKKFGLLLFFTFLFTVNISFGESDKNFVESIKMIDEKIIKTSNIETDFHFDLIFSLFSTSCNTKSLKKAENDVQMLARYRQKDISKNSYLAFLEERFDLVKNIVMQSKEIDLDNFCEEKYTLYKLLQLSQDLYFQKSEKKSDVHGSATPKQYLQFVHKGENLSAQNQSLVEITDTYLQEEVEKLLEKHFLTEEDLEILEGGITVNYQETCQNTKGSFHFLQNKSKTIKKIKSIILNINLCDSEEFKEKYHDYVKQIFIHELSHYFYFFKDAAPENFTSLCRGDLHSCNEEDFVSSYAQSNSEEDYAESFAYWYLDSFNGKEKEHGVSSPTLEKKIQYFDHFTIK